jgi:putative endonuclease
LNKRKSKIARWYLYLLRCKDGSLYTGITTDVERRFSEHRGKGNKGAKYCRGKAPIEIAYVKKIGSQSRALKIEYRVKRLTKQRKEKIIRDSEDVLVLFRPHPGSRLKPAKR